MAKLYALVLAPLVLTFTLATSGGQTSGRPETILVHNGSATLHAMVWRPPGHGPFPGILLNHGSGRAREELERLGPYERNAEKLGPVFCSPSLCIPVLVQARCRAFRGSGPKRRRLNEQGIRRTRTRKRAPDTSPGAVARFGLWFAKNPSGFRITQIKDFATYVKWR
jgi:hypothetical protein